MNDLSTSSQYSITRSTFQNLLHHALIADGDACNGLLAASATSPSILQHIELTKGAEIDKKLTGLKKIGFICIGLFHIENQTDELLLAVMPETYIELSVSLGEEGRLDLHAFHHHKNDSAELTLVLIEDGQLEEDA